MVRICILAALAWLAASPAAADVENCTGDESAPVYNADLEIGACTAVIRSGDYSGAGVAFAFNNRGIAYYNLGDYRQAIADYDQALRLDPGDPLTLNNRGNAFDALGEHQRAIEDFDQALQLDQTYAVGFNNRGIAYYNLEEYRRAIADYSEALRLDPSYVSVYNNRGNALVSLGELREAIAEYDEALQLDPTYALAYDNRGIAKERLGDVEGAVADWEADIRLRGPARIKWWQEWTRDHGGHYRGVIDGVYGESTRAALIACAKDPDC